MAVSQDIDNFFKFDLFTSEIDKLRKTTDLKDQTLKSNQAQIQILTQHIGFKEQHIQDIKVYIEDKERHIQDIKVYIEDKERHIQDIKVNIEGQARQIADKERQIADKERQIAYKERHIQTLEGRLADKEHQIKSISGQVLEKEVELKNNTLQTEDLRKNMAAMGQTIDALRNSRAIRTATFLRKNLILRPKSLFKRSPIKSMGVPDPVMTRALTI